MTAEESIAYLLQKVADLKIRQARVSQIITRHTAMVKKLAPLHDNALKQLEQALETKLEIDTLLGYTEQLIIDAEAALKHSAEDGETE
jgi:hypothetical protein